MLVYFSFDDVCSSKLSGDFPHLGTDHVCGQIFVHIFAPNRGYCWYTMYTEHWNVVIQYYQPLIAYLNFFACLLDMIFMSDLISVSQSLSQEQIQHQFFFNAVQFVSLNGFLSCCDKWSWRVCRTEFQKRRVGPNWKHLFLWKAARLSFHTEYLGWSFACANYIKTLAHGELLRDKYLSARYEIAVWGDL